MDNSIENASRERVRQIEYDAKHVNNYAVDPGAPSRESCARAELRRRGDDV